MMRRTIGFAASLVVGWNGPNNAGRAFQERVTGMLVLLLWPQREEIENPRERDNVENRLHKVK